MDLHGQRYGVFTDSLMKLFLDIPKKLEEAGLLKKGCIAKAEAIITELLGEWFNGICNFLQEILPKPSTQVK